MTECIRKLGGFSEECGHGTSTKTYLMNHMATVHNIGDKKFKCEQCPYETIVKGNLKQHIESVHAVGDNKFTCELYVLINHTGSVI